MIARGRSRRRAGFTLVELTVSGLLVGMIAALLAAAWPAFNRAATEVAMRGRLAQEADLALNRIAQDLAGGLMVTMPSEQDFRSEEIGHLLEKYLKGRSDVPTESRVRILRLIENLTLGRNAVGYLTESMHGAGSPQAQRIQIARQMQTEFKKQLAKELAGVEQRDRDKLTKDLTAYFAKVFDTDV